MKRANGYGCIINLGKGRRKPYAARITNGWTDDGKQIFKYIGYAKTKREAENMLLEFVNSNINFDTYNITFKEVFEQWFKNKKQTIAETNSAMYQAAFKYSKNLHDMKFRDIRSKHMEKAIRECPRGIGTKKKMKTLYNQLYAYVLKNTLVDVKDFSRYIDMPKPTEDDIVHKTPFSKEEIQTLWDNKDSFEHADTILILIYMGWRISELFDIKKENVFLEERYIIGGSKTSAGKNRIVPIHHKILPLIDNLYNKNKKYLIENAFHRKMQYSNFRREKWDIIMKELNMNHLPHETRHTTATLLDEFGANKNAIQKILGHASKTITDRTYIHKDLSQLIEAIEKIEV